MRQVVITLFICSDIYIHSMQEPKKESRRSHISHGFEIRCPQYTHGLLWVSHLFVLANKNDCMGR